MSSLGRRVAVFIDGAQAQELRLVGSLSQWVFPEHRVSRQFVPAGTADHAVDLPTASTAAFLATTF